MAVRGVCWAVGVPCVDRKMGRVIIGDGCSTPANTVKVSAVSDSQ